MAKKVVRNPETPEDWLTRTNNAILACRGQGHAWPKLRPGNARGIEIEHVENGVFQITFTCPQCGTTRTLTTAPRGELVFPASYKYQYPDGYKAPKGTSRRSCVSESWRRTLEKDYDGGF